MGIARPSEGRFHNWTNGAAAVHFLSRFADQDLKKKYFCYPLWPRCNTRVQQEHLFFVIVICRFVKSESTKGTTAISVLTLILPTFVPARRLWMSSHLSWFHFLTLKGSRERKKTYRDSNRCGTLGIYCHWVAKIAVVHILHRSCCAFKTHPILL